MLCQALEMNSHVQQLQLETWARLYKMAVTTTGTRTCTRNLSELH